MLLRSGRVINLLHVVSVGPDIHDDGHVYVMLTGAPIDAIKVDKEDAQQIRNAVIDLTSCLMAKLL